MVWQVNRPKSGPVISALAAGLVLGAGPDPASAEAPDRRNVLFIAVDDLKPALRCFGDELALTPNIDRLASMGTVFANTHCQQAVCAPSRVSLMSGLRPDATRVWDLQTRFRDRVPDLLTLPQHLKASGYEVAGMGKLFDSRSTSDGWHAMDAASWTVPYEQPTRHRSGATFGYLGERSEEIRRKRAAATEQGITHWREQREFVGIKPSVDRADVEDEAYGDGELAARGVARLRELAGGDRPWFLGVGFSKPHLPFAAPERYWAMYERELFAVHPLQSPAEGAPGFHFQDSWELRTYTDIPPRGTPIPHEQQLELIHGYYACVSFIDAQVGKLLDALEASGEADETVIVLWGDHGFHLGDQGMFCKHTNYEQATRSPLIVAAPGVGAPGVVSGAPVEFVDVFPTVTDLSGVPTPSGLHGVSLRALMNEPAGRVKDVAVSQFPRWLDERPVMGYAFRDARYRYIVWRRCAGDEVGAGVGEVIARELYDYEDNPFERRNLARDADRAGTVRRFERLSAAYFVEYLPTPSAARD